MRSGIRAAICAATPGPSPERIVLVSCDPGTLARDLGALHGRGYAVERVVPEDLFPQTPHVETVTALHLSSME